MLEDVENAALFAVAAEAHFRRSGHEPQGVFTWDLQSVLVTRTLLRLQVEKRLSRFEIGRYGDVVVND